MRPRHQGKRKCPSRVARSNDSRWGLDDANGERRQAAGPGVEPGRARGPSTNSVDLLHPQKNLAGEHRLPPTRRAAPPLRRRCRQNRRRPGPHAATRRATHRSSTSLLLGNRLEQSELRCRQRKDRTPGFGDRHRIHYADQEKLRVDVVLGSHRGDVAPRMAKNE